MMTFRNLLAACSGAAACIALIGCEADVARDPSRSARAVESPTERNSASGELASMTEMSGVPLVEVGLPNHPGERPVVRTVVDNIVRPPVTQPPTITTTATPGGITVGGASTQPLFPSTQPVVPTTQPQLRVDPVMGPRE